jgi:hypothetical protein
MFSLKRWVAAATVARQQFETLKGGASAPSGSATSNLREGEPQPFAMKFSGKFDRYG